MYSFLLCVLYFKDFKMQLIILLLIYTSLLFSFDPKELMLLKEYKNQPIEGYFMSEKYDGVRA